MKKVIGIVIAILIILFVICNIIFFNIFGNNKDIKKYIISSDIYGRDLKELKNNNYCCAIYREDDKSIEILEEIR